MSITKQPHLALVLLTCAACSDLLGIDDFTDQGVDTPAGDSDSPASGGSGGEAGAGGGGGPSTASQSWARAFGAASSQDLGSSVSISLDDEVIVAGTIGGIVDFGGGTVGTGADQLFVTRLSSEGEFVASTASIGGATIELAGAVADLAGNAVIAGSFAMGDLTLGGVDPPQHVAGADSDIFVAKLDGDGAWMWEKSFEATDDQTLRAVATDPRDGAVVVVGSLRGSLDMDGDMVEELTSAGGENVLVARFTTGGDLMWAKSLGDGGSALGAAVTVDTQGSIWVAGTFNGTADFEEATHVSVGNTDIFVMRLDEGGAVQATARFGSGGGHILGDLVASDDGVIMVGGFTGTTTFGSDALEATSGASEATEDIFVASLDASAAARWSRSFGGTGSDVGMAVSVDSLGNIIVGGRYASSLFELGLDTESAGGADALILKLDPVGDLVWGSAFGRNSDDWVGGVAVDSEDAVLTTGQFVDGFMFMGDIIQGKGMEDIFVAKLLP